jgi:hypothetical protein
MLYSSYVSSCFGALGIEEEYGRPNSEIGSKSMVVESMINSKLVVDGKCDEF